MGELNRIHSSNLVNAFEKHAESALKNLQGSKDGRVYITVNPETGEVGTTTKKSEQASFKSIQALYREAMQDKTLSNADANKLEQAMNAILLKRETKINKNILYRVFPSLKPNIEEARVEKHQATRTEIKRPIEKTQIAMYHNIQEADKEKAQQVLANNKIAPQNALALYIYSTRAFEMVNAHLRDRTDTFESQVRSLVSLSQAFDERGRPDAGKSILAATPTDIRDEDQLSQMSLDNFHGECSQVAENALAALNQIPSDTSNKPLYRAVAFSPEIWNQISEQGQLKDKAFLSTSANQDEAYRFLNSSYPNESVKVMFEIVNHRSAKDISSLSKFEDQQEFLFRPGVGFNFNRDDIEERVTPNGERYLHVTVKEEGSWKSGIKPSN
jgi:hypothetical protein